MTWFVILLLAAIVLLLLWRYAAFRGGRLQFLASALLIALAGYAWQGRPDLPAAPKSAEPRQTLPPTGFQALRHEFLPRFDSAARWLILSDAMQRRGNTADAVGAIRAGLRREPRNMSLWTGLGYALTVHGGGLNQAAELAYARAIALGQGHPAPRFFYGLSLIESGRVEEGDRMWRALLADAPADASWRPMLAERVELLAQLRAMAAEEGGHTGAP